jgi:outer membrane receptor protein involved in Fe transport
MTKDGFSINVGDNHKFNDKGHELKFNTTLTSSIYDKNTTNLTQYNTDASFIPGNEINLQTKNTNVSDGYDFRADLDYTWPFSDKGIFEAGYQLRSEQESSDIKYLEMNQSTSEWEIDDLTSNSYEYVRNIHAAYFTIANQFSFADVKLGLRAEYTDRSLDQFTLNNEYAYESLDFYPSAYITKRFANKQQVQLNYSRRVNRPRGHFLNPYTFRSDGFSSFKGNPEIEPEFANSYELNYQKYFGKSFVSVESYFRQTVNKMTRTINETEDGLYEMTNTAGEVFGPERLKISLARHRRLPGTDIFEWVLKDIGRFAVESDFADDICAVMVEYASTSSL